MTRHRAHGRREAGPADLPVDLAAVQRDDLLLDRLGQRQHQSEDADGELARALADGRREVHIDSDRELIDTETALAAMRTRVGHPFASGVMLLAVVVMVGVTLGVVVTHLALGLFSALIWGLGAAAVGLALALGAIAYRERRR